MLGVHMVALGTFVNEISVDPKNDQREVFLIFINTDFLERNTLPPHYTFLT